MDRFLDVRRSLTVFFAAYWTFKDNKSNTFTLGWVAFYLSFVINNPHFIFSYQLYYGNHLKEVKSSWKNFAVGILIPLFLVVLYMCFFKGYLVHISPFLVNTMYFLVGWHYVKQIYGCVMMTSYMNQYVWNPQQKTVMRFNMYSLWAISYLNSNSSVYTYVQSGVSYSTFFIPAIFFKMSFAIMALTLAWLLYSVYQNYIETGSIPPMGSIVSFLSIYIWYIPIFYHPHFFVLIPFFHSLQYLTFVLAYYKNKSLDQNRNLTGKLWRKQNLWMIARPILFAVVVGALAFRFIPLALDKSVNYDQALLGSMFFIFAFENLLNIHHYFIDNLIWRSSQSDVKKYILAPDGFISNGETA